MKRVPVTVRVMVALIALLAAASLILPAPGAVDQGDESRPQDFTVGLALGDSARELSDAELAYLMDDVRDLGATSVRIDFSWTLIEPAQGRLEWAATDRIVEAARSRQISVLGVVTYTPPWARDAGCSRFTCPPADPRAFARFAADVVERYGARALPAIELWNEPNLDFFWSDPDPRRYGELVRQSTRAVRSVDRGRTILFGGMPIFAGDYIPADEFLRAACAARRCQRIDGVAMHPYTGLQAPGAKPIDAWTRLLTSLPGEPSIAATMKDVGLGERPIWITEFGAPTRDASFDDGSKPTASRFGASEERQAEIVGEGITKARRGAPDIAAIYLYTWQDDPRQGRFGRLGLRNADRSAKPSWAAVKKATSSIR